MNKETEKILTEFDGFTDGVRVLMLLAQNKDKVEKQTSFKRVSKNREEFEEFLDLMIDMKNEEKEPRRIYSCANERDVKKAIRIFKTNQLDADYYNEDDKNMFYFDVKNRWISSLMKKRARAETSFIIDIDTDEGDDVKKAEELLFNIVGRNFKKFKTKNGFHLVTPPFNPHLMDGYKINSDGLLLLSY